MAEFPNLLADLLNLPHVHGGFPDADMDARDAGIRPGAVERFDDVGDGGPRAGEKFREGVTRRLLRNVALNPQGQHGVRSDALRGVYQNESEHRKHEENPEEPENDFPEGFHNDLLSGPLGLSERLGQGVEKFCACSGASARPLEHYERLARVFNPLAE